MVQFPYEYDLMIAAGILVAGLSRHDDEEHARVKASLPDGTEHITVVSLDGRPLEDAQRAADDAMLALLTREIVTRFGWPAKESPC